MKTMRRGREKNNEKEEKLGKCGEIRNRKEMTKEVGKGRKSKRTGRR
jgi:hypothetical protein